MTLEELERKLSEATGREDVALSEDLLEALNIASYIPDEGDPLTSLDAAVWLCGEVLPGWRWIAHTLCGLPFARVESADFEAVEWTAGDRTKTDVVSGSDASATGKTPALALCIAIVRALKAKPKAPGHG